MDKPAKTYKVELRELQPLLRKKLGDKLIVVNFNTSPLLPLGENYGSTILKVEATVKRSENAPEEELHLVAKMMPATDFQRAIFDSPFTFRKEAFLYEELVPSYQRLERELGIEDVFDIVPELFGVRFSLKEGENEFDDDAIILMQNIKELGYYTCDRRQGLNAAHARLAATALARFHALGMAMKKHHPDYFEILKIRAKCLEFQMDQNFEEQHQFFIKTISEDEEMGQYQESIQKAMAQESATTWTTAPPEAWATIVHSDFWINNFLFRKDAKTDQPIDIKFVDFQNFLVLSPLRELTFFLMTNFDEETMNNHFDELLDLYYEQFIDRLKKMNCDVDPFSRDKFDARLKIDAFEEFPHCPFMIKAITASFKKDDRVEDMQNLVTRKNLDSNFLSRLRRCVKKYAEKGWLST